MPQMYVKINGRSVDLIGHCTIEGVRYEYYGMHKWGKMYYTFDWGDTWSASKREAFFGRKQ